MASIVILSIALCVLWVSHNVIKNPEPVIVIREISLATLPPPPPPPPPVKQQQMVQSPVTLQIQGQGPSLKMVHVDKKITIKKPDMPNMIATETSWQSLEIDWQAFKLSDLDGLPTLLTSLKINLPNGLIRKGIKRVPIKLEVMINESGHITLINIIENPYAELKSEIKRLIRGSRFSVPKRNNQAVRARFIWPLEITS